MIRFTFDRSKLTPREAQILEALIDTRWGLQLLAVMTLKGQHKPGRTKLEEAAEDLRRQLSGIFPDLQVRWDWTEDPEQPPSPPRQPTAGERWQAEMRGMTKQLEDLQSEKVEEANADAKTLAVPLATLKKIREKP